MNAAFVPATGWSCLLRFYDPLVAACTREATFKKHMMECLKSHGAVRVLDVGCGSGTFAIGVQQVCPTVKKIVAVDVDDRILEQARRKRGARSIEWLAADATSLPFAKQHFDAVCCSLLLHHLLPEQKRQVLSEMQRVLTPSGLLVLADFCQPNSAWGKVRFLPVRLLDGWKRTNCNQSGRLPELIYEAGFGSIKNSLTLNCLLGTIRVFNALRVKNSQHEEPISESPRVRSKKDIGSVKGD